MAVFPPGNGFTVLSSKEYRQALKSWGVGDVLTDSSKKPLEGKYGKIHGTNTPCLVAKCLKPKASDDPEAYAERAKEELSILSYVSSHKLRHVPVQLAAFTSQGEYTSIQRHAGKTLRERFIRGPEAIGATMRDIQHIAYQLFEALKDLHEHRIFHGDLHRKNLLIDDTGHLTVADFSVSRRLREKHQIIHDCLFFDLNHRPPELMVRPAQATIRADIWAAGCTLLPLLTKTNIFPGDSVRKVFRSIRIRLKGAKGKGNSVRRSLREKAQQIIDKCKEEDREKTAQFMDLIQKLLAFDPHDRLFAEQALEHPFLKSYAAEHIAYELPIQETTQLQVLNREGEVVARTVLPKGSYCYHVPAKKPCTTALTLPDQKCYEQTELEEVKEA